MSTVIKYINVIYSTEYGTFFFASDIAQRWRILYDKKIGTSSMIPETQSNFYITDLKAIFSYTIV